MNVLIVNYGTCNISSIYNSIKKIKKVKIFINDFNKKKINKIIFPGQGHVKICMNFINKFPNLLDMINNIDLLGICIGYHLFFKKSYEDLNIKCLNYFNDDIVELTKKCCLKTILPNIGWKEVIINKYHKIFNKIPKNFNQYFMHSYSSLFKNQFFSYAISNIDNFYFNSIVIDKNKFLFQFHPEKSGKYGLQLIKNFLEL